MNAPEKIEPITAKQQFLAEHLRDGEHYAGLIIGKDGEPDYHLFLLPGEAESVTFKQAGEWAKKVSGELPTRREQSLLFANLKEHFQPRWYWSCEASASVSDSAWTQGFVYGDQYSDDIGYRNRARAVRRLILQ